MIFEDLSEHAFEQLCARLLIAEGFTLELQEARSRDIGIDFKLVAPDQTTWVAQIKHFRRPRAGTAVLRSTSVQLGSAREFVGARNALLISSMHLPAGLKDELQQRERIVIWDEMVLRELLRRHPQIEADYVSYLRARGKIKDVVAEEAVIDWRGHELIKKLESLPAGRDYWAQYETLGTEILNYVFYPDLGVPSIQSRSEDGLDIRDAVYPIKSTSQFWSEIRQLTRSRSLVAEFKNHSEGISQREVESTQQYLYAKAMRMLGLICTRTQPKHSAVMARRRAWVEADKLILFLTDDDMKDLVRAKPNGEKPTDVLDAQLEEFLLRLAP